MPNLFEGQSFTSVENPATGDSNKSHETHKQIELNIDGCKDLYDAFEKRCKVMKVEGGTVRIWLSLPRITRNMCLG